MAAPRSRKSATSKSKLAKAGVADMTGDAVPRGAAQTDQPATPGRSEASPARKTLDRLMCDAAGIPNPRAARMMVNQAANTVYRPAGRSAEEEKDASFDTLAQLLAFKPKDVLEGMLASQMVGTHNAAMECLRRAQLANQTPEGRDLNLKNGVKLMGLFTRQAEAFDKHRNRGQQRITVEHVTVNAGGQAIVGGVSVGDGGSRVASTPAAPVALPNDPGDLAPVMATSAAQVAEPVEVGSVYDDGR